ncbi:MAG: DUF6323 family protein [Coprobacillaceae bacterium]
MFDLEKMNFTITLKERVDSILACNKVLERYDLVLTEDDARNLLEKQYVTLKDVGRIELQGKIIEELISTFSDSQFFTKYDFANQIQELLEIFYYYKEATDEILSDEDIIKYLYLSFEGSCQGSLSWLGDNQLNELLDALNNGEDIFEGVKYGTY